MAIQYDTRFDNVRISILEEYQAPKLIDVIDAGMNRDEYVTIEDIKAKFSISAYHVRAYLNKLGALPFGQLKNIKEDGSRTRGVGKVVYRASIIDDVNQMLNDSINISKYHEDAKKKLENMS